MENDKKRRMRFIFLSACYCFLPTVLGLDSICGLFDEKLSAEVYAVENVPQVDEDSHEIVIDFGTNLHEYLRIVAELNRQENEKEVLNLLELEGHITEEEKQVLDIKTDREQLPSVGDYQQSGTEQQDSEESCLYAVLLKTRGLDFDALLGFSTAPFCRINGPDSCYTLYYLSGAEAKAAAEYYNSLDGVLYAEKDSVVWTCEANSALMNQIEDVHSGSYSFNSWACETMHYDSYIPYTASWGDGETEVAIIDSGVCFHPFLDSRVKEVGYDYVDADEDPHNDLFGHGTHVAGIVADCTRELPIFLFPIRVLGSTGGGKMSNVVNAVREAVVRKVDVINLSIESRTVSEALDDAILSAVDAGITVVCAAGNSNSDTSLIYPAHLQQKGVIVVGAVEMKDETCQKASYSNYGTSVDVYAFGSGILSCSISGGYKQDTGTSMAAPHISALAAMLKLIHPSLLPESIEDRIVVAGKTEFLIPDLIAMIPETEGFSLHTMIMNKGETIALPGNAFPLSSCESIVYTTQDSTVVSITGKFLYAVSEGETQITVNCTGFLPVTFTVYVQPDHEMNEFLLPENLKRLEDEAFRGMDFIEFLELPEGLSSIGSDVLEDCGNLRFIRIPDSVNEIGQNTFSDGILLCQGGSTAMKYAIENEIQYIIEGGELKND